MKLRTALIICGIALVLMSVGVTRSIYKNLPTPSPITTTEPTLTPSAPAVSPKPVNQKITALPSGNVEDDDSEED